MHCCLLSSRPFESFKLAYDMKFYISLLDYIYCISCILSNESQVGFGFVVYYFTGKCCIVSYKYKLALQWFNIGYFSN
jgi:hypothetical protein